MAAVLGHLSIEVIATGNELLDGTTSDTNTQRLALFLKEFGLKIHRTTVILDDPNAISRALVEAITRSDVVLVSGGLGPTTDDITLDVAARTFGVPMIKSSEALKNVNARLKRFNRKSNPGNLKQAFIPKGSEVLRNAEGTAPGISWKVGDRQLFFLPGVPRELLHLLDEHLRPWFHARREKMGEHLVTLKIFGFPESEISEWIKKQKLPEGVNVGFRTHWPENHIKFDVKARNSIEAQRRLKPIISKCRAHFKDKLFSLEGEKFEEVVLKDLVRKRLKVAIAESCTGGLATSMLTSVAGSSAVLERSFVTYSNESKEELLGVRSETLKKYGAVSKEVATEMAAGALKKSKAHIAVAITGIAGPSGGTKQKPVGTVWLAFAKKGKPVQSRLLRLGPSREFNQKYSAYTALQWLRTA